MTLPLPVHMPQRPGAGNRTNAAGPRLIFWESTRACPLACVHCRAAAQPDPLPGELTSEEAAAFLDAAAGFGSPPPMLIVTGGDPLLRADLPRLLEHAARRGLPVALSPAVGPRLDRETLAMVRGWGVRSISVSIDAIGQAHDRIRRVAGTYDRSVAALRAARSLGLPVQVNTVVMRRTVAHLPALAAMLIEEGVRVWEVFFLVATGRAQATSGLAPLQVEDVCHFLLDVTAWGLQVRAVEAPFLRRVQAERLGGGGRTGPTYRSLRRRFEALAGPAPGPAAGIPWGGTLDGDGILFVAHDGTISPGGLLPLSLGNVRRDDLVQVYRGHTVLRDIRERRFHGPCGACAWRRICGGSRARAYAATGDPLGSDPACRETVRGAGRETHPQARRGTLLETLGETETKAGARSAHEPPGDGDRTP